MTASFRFSKTRQNKPFLAFLINFCTLKKVDRKLPASHVAHEVLCLASNCRSYLTHLIFANWLFDRNVFCPLVVCQSYFARGYLPVCTLPDGILPMCTLHVSILHTEGKLHTGKLPLANYHWQNTHGQSTSWQYTIGKVLHGQLNWQAMYDFMYCLPYIAREYFAHEGFCLPEFCQSCLASMYSKVSNNRV